MKKSGIMAVSAAAVIALASCGSKGNVEANLATSADSLSYSIGVLNYNPMMKNALEQQLGIDSTAYAAFVQGYIEGANCTDMKEKARIIGFTQGMSSASDNTLKEMASYFFGGDSTKTINKQALIAGFTEAFSEKDTKLSIEEARAFMTEYQRKMNEEKMLKQYGDWKAENEKFLEENKTKEGVKTTASGLQYKVIKEGKGAVPADSVMLAVKYKGSLIDGTVFDESKDKPFECSANGRVIEGWKEALKLFPAGSVVEIYVPQTLGYGSSNMGKIKPFSTLIFNMEINLKK